MAATFLKGFQKTAKAGVASFMQNHKKLEYAGLGLLGGTSAIHLHKAMKEKDKGGMAAAGADMAGLGLLARAVHKA